MSKKSAKLSGQEWKAKHGFGEGRGSDAEGWIEYAVEFWENQRGKM